MIEQRHIVGLIFYSTPTANNTARVVSWSGCKYLCGTWIGYYVLVLNREAKQWKLTFISDLGLNCRQWMWDNSQSQRTYFLNGISSWNSVLLIKNCLWMHFLIETICDFEWYPNFSGDPFPITEEWRIGFIYKSSDLKICFEYRYNT